MREYTDRQIEEAAKNPVNYNDIKAPPYSMEAEQSVIGGLLLSNDAFDDVIEIISEQNFYHKNHGLIFRAIEMLAKEDKPFDAVTLSEALKSLGELERIGGLVYLVELAKNTPGVSNIKAYAEIVRERFVHRELILTANAIAENSYWPNGQSSAEALDAAERKILSIAEKGPKKGGPVACKEILSSTVDRIAELFESTSAITGLSTGFDDLDAQTSGLQPGELTIVAARPSMGKTTFAMNLVENAIMKTEKPALVFSLEMHSESIMMRMIASLGRINQTRVSNGKFLEDDWPKFNSAVAQISEKKLFIDDECSLSPTDIRARARRIAKEHGQIGMIMVDYLQLMKVSGMENNRVAEVSEISRSLKALAKELNVPVVALSQLNRSLEQRPNKRPINSDLRESGAIEQDADLIIFLYRDEVYNEQSDDKGMAEIIIGKQRNGPVGTTRLAFNGEHSRFENLAHNSYSDYPQN